MNAKTNCILYTSPLRFYPYFSVDCSQSATKIRWRYNNRFGDSEESHISLNVMANKCINYYTVWRHICCFFKTPTTCQHIRCFLNICDAVLYILLLEGQIGVNIWGVNICDAGQYIESKKISLYILISRVNIAVYFGTKFSNYSV